MTLVHQVPHGGHDQGRHLRLGHRGEGDFGLAGPGRHDDLPAPAGPIANTVVVSDDGSAGADPTPAEA